ncbi:unnamed protein product [Absidia cylindrospora]
MTVKKRPHVGGNSSGTSSSGSGGGQLEYGSLLPQGIYPNSTCNYDVKAVRKFIKEGLLAPFFIGLNEAPAGSAQPPYQTTTTPPDTLTQQSSPTTQSPKSNQNTASMAIMRNKIKDRLLLLRSSSTCQQTDQLLYNNTIECPICLLTYPDCVNCTRCCDKPICTDCFLQLRRSDESPLVPAACPFCVQPNLGVVHFPPRWSHQHEIFKQKRPDLFILWEHELGEENSHSRKRRRKKLGPNDRNVVLVDQIRPNWQDQLDLKGHHRHQHQQQHQHAYQTYVVESQLHGGHRRNRRRLSGSLSGSGTTRRIIVRPTMQTSLTSRTM